jgi:hypothetical protein
MRTKHHPAAISIKFMERSGLEAARRLTAASHLVTPAFLVIVTLSNEQCGQIRN